MYYSIYVDALREQARYSQMHTHHFNSPTNISVFTFLEKYIRNNCDWNAGTTCDWADRRSDWFNVACMLHNKCLYHSITHSIIDIICIHTFCSHVAVTCALCSETRSSCVRSTFAPQAWVCTSANWFQLVCSSSQMKSTAAAAVAAAAAVFVAKHCVHSTEYMLPLHLQRVSE